MQLFGLLCGQYAEKRGGLFEWDIRTDPQDKQDIKVSLFLWCLHKTLPETIGLSNAVWQLQKKRCRVSNHQPAQGKIPWYLELSGNQFTQ